MIQEDTIKSRKTISIARGNIVLADHGYSLLKSMDPALIESQRLLYAEDEDIYNGNSVDSSTDTHDHLDILKVEATEFLGYAPSISIGEKKFRPSLSQRPLTFMGPFDESLPASAALLYDVHKARPDISLTGEGRAWLPLRDLLQSREFDDNFVVEIENDGTAFIRFGYFENTEVVSAETDNATKTDYASAFGSPFFATYRVGNGIRGNVGAETITRIILDGVDGSLFTRCRNAMAA